MSYIDIFSKLMLNITFFYLIYVAFRVNRWLKRNKDFIISNSTIHMNGKQKDVRFFNSEINVRGNTELIINGTPTINNPNIKEK